MSGRVSASEIRPIVLVNKRWVEKHMCAYHYLGHPVFEANIVQARRKQGASSNA